MGFEGDWATRRTRRTRTGLRDWKGVLCDEDGIVAGACGGSSLVFDEGVERGFGDAPSLRGRYVYPGYFLMPLVPGRKPWNAIVFDAARAHEGIRQQAVG